jgi:hypothetical protein
LRRFEGPYYMTRLGINEEEYEKWSHMQVREIQNWG